MSRAEGSIFISYRRSDAGGWAGRLSDSLQQHLPRVHIFRDIHDIPPGVEFDTYITEAVGSCNVLIALIGPQWLTAIDKEGKRRLEDPADFTRKEISAALKRNVRVIPALVGEATIPSADQLPEDLKPLVRRQAYELTDIHWADDCRQLADGLRPLVEPASRRSRRAVAGVALLLCLAIIGVALAWYLKRPGKTANKVNPPLSQSAGNPPAGPQPASAQPANAQLESRTTLNPVVEEKSRGVPAETKSSQPVNSHPEADKALTKKKHEEKQRALVQKEIDQGTTAVREKRYKDAARLFRQASDAGSSDAMNRLGVLYVNGSGVTQDYQQARQWFEKASSSGNSNGMRNLGVIYARGLGVSQDYPHARQWYQKSADAGNTSAMVDLGAMYEHGVGTPIDFSQARQWFQKAADNGDGEAMLILGNQYAAGEGVTEDYKQARQWYLKAASSGNAAARNSAMYELGVSCENGYGVERDYQKARDWYEKSANGGDARGMYGLASLYERGKGVAKDSQKAREWFQKSASGGFKPAEARLQDLAK